MKRKCLIIFMIAMMMFLCNCSNDVYNERPSVEETGDITYSELESSYTDGWNEACEEVFSDYSELYYDGYQYSFDDFYDYVDGSPSIYESYPDTDYPYVAADEDEAYYQGREAALDTIFWDTDVLCYGEDRYYRSDY